MQRQIDMEEFCELVCNTCYTNERTCTTCKFQYGIQILELHVLDAIPLLVAADMVEKNYQRAETAPDTGKYARAFPIQHDGEMRKQRRSE